MRKLTMVTLVTLTLLLAACDSNDPEASDDTVEGVYALQTVGGKALPATILQVLSDTIEITAGSIRLNANMSFVATLSVRTTESGVVTTESASDTGTFSMTGSTIRLAYADGTADSGSVTNGVLTVSSEGIAMIFRK